MTNRFDALFRRLGFPLDEKAGEPETAISAAEERLGVRVPKLVREYYRLAGREPHLHRSHNTVYSSAEWRVIDDRLVFMSENQGVCIWGMPLSGLVGEDPPVHQGVCGDVVEWHDEHASFSVFIDAALHLQAVWGGLPFAGQAAAPENLLDELDTGWRFTGEVNSMRPFSKPGKVICVFLDPGGGHTVALGATSQTALDDMCRSLGLERDRW